ncbi:MAG: replication and repair protein RecF protein [Candidatus Woesebacteria bacterium GW2011_GWA1_33_30]|uniref:DNA replication and repair protein RecF n=1 Tax=Candidatus Woesebacteria bacterium GW2011_GWA2_33_28 TaxID=1618561 RepID=A0A0F9ZTA3_9BACT|nr:MAG: replication and repair protein RecF protein [Candidatus Woesebacteria bacterium GW2011_GWA2_33_28]KKP48400.1 MAG: replication and repair protein RecF protein [Candidatus Woesebacteria bacterium GW2011_GWA1_33_30]KKP49507.1 MAG: replication and repair protein RecF protein [Microgenomates group bacterium GW2011_GWC1_33_32]KKP52472.1 MAG: replication and repair protein RecF protein [Candidatus Woesebacteria bacterium GW2011_GWB1_33_38]KKP58330.1 MAG: replication and repair protein RecF pro
MIKKLKLTNFRNFTKKEFEFGEGITVINAPNAKGKTNILEAIFMLSTGKSFKARREEESINYDCDLARIKGDSLEIVLTKDIPEWPKKKLLVNGIARRMIDFAGNLKTTLFLPEDLDLVTSTPTLRRRFLDTVLSQVDREYRRAIGSYEKGVRQRNRILLRIREENISRSNLLFWNQLLIKNGNYITERRREFIEFINSLNKCNLKYDSSAISEGRLEQYKNEEIASAMTLVGPHRDDFIFLKNDRDLASYGSRGEQRMEILWLKLAELAFVEAKTGELPTLLLDDIFSELDHEHRKIVLDSIGNHQVIITSADEHNLPKIKSEELKIINL